MQQPVRRKPKVAQKATLKLNSKGLTTAGKVAGALGVGVDVVRRALAALGSEQRRRDADLDGDTPLGFADASLAAELARQGYGPGE